MGRVRRRRSVGEDPRRDQAGDQCRAGLHEQADAERSAAAGRHATTSRDHSPTSEELGQRRRQRHRRKRANGRRLRAHRLARTEDEGLDGRNRDADRVRDLDIRAALELAHDQGRALVEGQTPERAQQRVDVRPVIVGKSELLDVVIERHLLHATAGP